MEPRRRRISRTIFRKFGAVKWYFMFVSETTTTWRSRPSRYELSFIRHIAVGAFSRTAAAAAIEILVAKAKKKNKNNLISSLNICL